MIARYALFAGLAMLANLSTQEIVVRVAPGNSLAPAILSGTLAGFVLKYLLDKRWVFDDGYSSHRQELQPPNGAGAEDEAGFRR